MRISDWSSDVCSSDLLEALGLEGGDDALGRAVAVVEVHLVLGDLAAAPAGVADDGRLAVLGPAKRAALAAEVPGVGGGLSVEALGRLEGLRAAAAARLHVLPDGDARLAHGLHGRSEEHTSELQSLMRIAYAV